MSEVPEKHPKLVLMFKQETSKKAILLNGKITKQFKYWLSQKLKYKSLICNDPNCPKFGQEFPSKISLAHHKRWHNQEYRESHSGENNSKGMLGKHHTEETRNIMSNKKKGNKNPNYGKCGEKHQSFKKDAKYIAIHIWIRKYYPPEEICNNKCEMCGKFRLDLDLAQFVHTNKRNMDNPMVDYFYACHYNEKNSCHQIYDRLIEAQKEELLAGATTREEKLERVKEYVMKRKRIKEVK